MIQNTKALILLMALFVTANCCYAQQQQDFYNKRHAVDSYKKSMLDFIGPDTLKSYRLRYFKKDIAGLDTLRFYSALDTLKAYDKGQYTDY
jgi:hypothetical protein